MANNSFTFWSNMKEAIDCYDSNPAFKCKLYDALIEYGLYEVLPEDDGSLEVQSIKAFLQSVAPSLDKSRNYYKEAAERDKTVDELRKTTDAWLAVIIFWVIIAAGEIMTWFNKEDKKKQ